MRKLYAFLAGLILLLAKTNSADAKNLSPDLANFTFAIDAPNNNVVFTNTSTIGSEPGPRKAYWNFGDGIVQQTPPLQGTQHHYQVAGTYTVCLRLYRYFSNTSDSVLTGEICKTFIIETVCHADFTVVSAAANALGKYFLAQPSHNQNKKPVYICWAFGDGRDTCIQYSNTYTGAYSVYHLYNQPGNYNACVTINYEGGCHATTCHPVQVGNPDSCRADFERVQVAVATNPLRAYFNALPWHNNNKPPVRICWNFGDGTDTCIQYSNTNPGGPYVVGHTYANPGTYEVCVNILYLGGCEAMKCKPVVMARPDTCHADFERTQVTAAIDPLLAVFKALPQHNNNRKPARICWNFGDNRDTCINYPENYNGQYIVTHRYDHPGVYEVCVNIKYYGGCEAQRCRAVVMIRPDTCHADFERLPTTNNDPLRVNLKALPQHNNNRKPARICWNFGDGRDTCINYPENYTGQYIVSHTYSHTGLYQICVNIKYYGGCEDSKCKPAQVGPPDSCTADFERSPVIASTPLTVGLKALPWNNNNRKPSRICWNFGDGRDTCINYPENYTGLYVVSHNYLQPGQYQVCVNIRYYGGCEATKCKAIVVPQPNNNCSVTLFEITPSITSLTRGFVAVPVSVPPGPVQRICWHFGDGTDTCIMLNATSPVTNYTISHTYPGPGVYHVCVNVRFVNGCETSACREVVINRPPNVCGGYMTDSLVGPRTYRFKGFSIHAPNDNVTGYHWTFGDGTSANGQEVTHTYNQGGNYNVCLLITTQRGCETRICKPLHVAGNNQTGLILSPNPVITVLTATFFSTHTEPVTIKILNSMGTIVRTYVRNANTGPNTWSFDLASLLPGIYSFVVQSPNQLASAIFLKQ